MTTKKYSLAVLNLLSTIGDSLVFCEHRIDGEVMERASSEDITKMVRGALVNGFCKFAVDNYVLNDASCIQMEDDLRTRSTRYRARIYMLPPAKLEELLQQAFDSGVNLGREFSWDPFAPNPFDPGT